MIYQYNIKNASPRLMFYIYIYAKMKTNQLLIID